MGMSFDLLTLVLVALITLILGAIGGFLYPLMMIPDVLAFLFNKKKELIEVNYGTGEIYYVTPKKDSFGNTIFKINGFAHFVDTDTIDDSKVSHWGQYRIRRYWAGSSLPTNATNSSAITQVLEHVYNDLIDYKNPKTSKHVYENLGRLKKDQVMNLVTCDLKLLKQLIEKYIPTTTIDEKGNVVEMTAEQYATEKALKTLEIGKEVAKFRMQVKDEYMTPRFLLLPYAENATQQKISPNVLRDVESNTKQGMFNKEEWMRNMMNYAIIFTIIIGGVTICGILIYMFIGQGHK